MQLKNSGDCREKSSQPFEVRLGTVKGKLMLFNIIEKKLGKTNFHDKLQFGETLSILFDENTIPQMFNQYISFNS